MVKLEAVYRFDYPLYASEANGSNRIVGYDPDLKIEENPLGLFFKFSHSPNGLMINIANDAEQVSYQVRNAANPLAEPPNYFGFISPVDATSKLQTLVGCELQGVFFGFADAPSTSSKLLLGIKLQFRRTALAFVNHGDEGYFLFENDMPHQQHFAWLGELFTEIEWLGQPQLLKSLSAYP